MRTILRLLALLCVFSVPVSGQIAIHPIRLLPPPYPEMLRSSGVQGSVRFAATVTASGRIDMASVRIVESSHELLNAALRAALPQWRFSPQRRATPARQVRHFVRWILLPRDSTRSPYCPTGERGTTTVCAHVPNRQALYAESWSRRMPNVSLQLSVD